MDDKKLLKYAVDYLSKYDSSKKNLTYVLKKKILRLQITNLEKAKLIDTIDNIIFKLEKNNFIDEKTKKKIPEETVRLLHIQKDLVIKQLIEFPDLYYAKSHFPLEISQRAFEHLWRMCESYELWCKETKQNKLIILNVID